MMIQIGRKYTKGRNGKVCWMISDYDPGSDMVTLTSEHGNSDVRSYSDVADLIFSGRLFSIMF